MIEKMWEGGGGKGGKEEEAVVVVMGIGAKTGRKRRRWAMEKTAVSHSCNHGVPCVRAFATCHARTSRPF
jgi:hypothetical protein